MPKIHLAPFGAQFDGFAADGKPTASRIIVEPKVMLCDLGLPLRGQDGVVKVMVALDDPSLCKQCLAAYPKRMGSIQPVLYP
jgi:hypothetical protein